MILYISTSSTAMATSTSFLDAGGGDCGGRVSVPVELRARTTCRQYTLGRIRYTLGTR